MSTKTLNVLILEASLAEADAVEVQLHKTGLPCSIRRVSSKDLFLRAMQEFRPRLVIANVSVPRIDVLGVLTQSKREHPDASWIILSPAANEELAVNCMKAGASDYLNKKNLGRLASAAKHLLEKKEQAEETGPKEAAPPQPPAAAEKATSELEHLLQLSVEHSTDLVAILNKDGKRVYNNAAYKRVLEDPESLRGTDSFVDVHPEDREMVRRVFHESLLSGQGKRIEYRLLDMDGNFRYMESQGTVLRDEEGKTKGLSVISRDMTGRKKAELALQTLVAATASVAGDEFFSALVQHLANGLGVGYALVSETVTPKRDRVRALAYWANGQWVSRFEYDVANTTCEKVLLEGKMCYFPEHVQVLFPKESALVAMKAVCYLGLPLLHSSGEVIGHLFIIDDKPLSDFQYTRFVLSVFASRAAVELERKRALAMLEESEGVYRSMLESLNEGLVLTDMQDIITYANARIAVMTGYTVQEMVGKTWSTLVLPKEEWELLQLRNRERRKGVAERYQTKLRKKDGSISTVSISAAPYRDLHENIVGTLGIVTEVEGSTQ